MSLYEGDDRWNAGKIWRPYDVNVAANRMHAAQLVVPRICAASHSCVQGPSLTKLGKAYVLLVWMLAGRLPTESAVSVRMQVI